MTRVTISHRGRKAAPKTPPPPIDHSKLCGLCRRPEPPHAEIVPIGIRCEGLGEYEAVAYNCACGATRDIPKAQAAPALLSRARRTQREKPRWRKKR